VPEPAYACHDGLGLIGMTTGQCAEHGNRRKIRAVLSKHGPGFDATNIVTGLPIHTWPGTHRHHGE
jgi:hypothetical protein